MRSIHFLILTIILTILVVFSQNSKAYVFRVFDGEKEIAKVCFECNEDFIGKYTGYTYKRTFKTCEEK